jgi:hypothetical protein
LILKDYIFGLHLLSIIKTENIMEIFSISLAELRYISYKGNEEVFNGYLTLIEKEYKNGKIISIENNPINSIPDEPLLIKTEQEFTAFKSELLKMKQ